ncbi:CX domain-containing protein [Caenorhabditis elegans]|uniref:CX domain-containing protein n=1 Tax=Caenorhabditis elegans TaxID=6239 RepID=Q9U2Y6_CAEEL|nr:CX domain-containing protein [Caenorhabditis elegans]CAB60482.3 CX domain-containing protein [Caenorhabditis elegans]|eukprot:NP_507871.3 Uncharacterized protein CELE_Y113G7A.10 [Caenorhabditis elegans]
MQIFFLFFKFLKTMAENGEMKYLECYTTKEVIYDKFPKFTLEGEHTTIATYNITHESKTGPPACVMFFGTNGTHSATWQGHVSSFALPLECHINSKSYTHCFKSPNPFVFLELPNGWACCCSGHNCNWHNPSFFQFFERFILDNSELFNRLKAVCKYSFCIVFCVFITILWTIVEVLLTNLCEKRRKTCEESEFEMRNKIPSSLQLQPTQSSLKSRSGKNLSEMSLHPGSTLKVEKTQEDDVTEPKRSELEVASTQRSRINKDDDFVPIPEKPEWQTTKNGRLRRTSMNYEESTYSVLQE